MLSFNACRPHGIQDGPIRMRRPCTGSGNVSKGHTEDDPSDAASYHSGFAFPVPSPEFGGCGLSKHKGAGTEGPGLLLTHEKARLFST